MNGNENDIIQSLNFIVEQLLSGKRKFNLDVANIENVDNDELKTLAEKIVTLAEQYKECYGFIVDLSFGRLNTEPPRMNAFANPFKQLHSELRHLTWQIQEIANGDYDQTVSFSGDFSEAFNKMIVALRERQILTERIKENENLFRSIFQTSPEGILLCDLNNRIMNASYSAMQLLDISEADYGHLQIYDLIHPEDTNTFTVFLDSLLNNESGKTTAFAELRIITRNGDIIWSEQNASILLDSNSVYKGYIIIMRNISERKLAETQFLKYADELDESNRTKDVMFSIISHDLKNPLGALLGISKMLNQELENEAPALDKLKKYSKIIDEAATQTYNLLINLLEWSRIQTNHIEINPNEFNLYDAIKENVNINKPMAANKNIDIRYAAKGNFMVVNDRSIINTILRNLISNAVKYSHPNGIINVSLMQGDDIYIISVEDNGVGIAEDKLDVLFKSDTPHSTPGTANEKGTGLGLGLCMEFVHKIGGEIWVSSVLGKGSTFSFSVRSLQPTS